MKNHVALLVFFVFFSLNVFSQHLTVRQGKIDLRSHNFQSSESVRLDGEWEFYMSQLIAPGGFTESIPVDYIAFPDTWNDVSKSINPGDGYATYRLQLMLATSVEYAIELPHCYSNYILWLNGQKIASNGRVGDSKELSIPEWRPQTVTFQTDRVDNELILQISNFHHAKGGIRESISLDSEVSLLRKRGISKTTNVAVIVLLVIVAVFFSGVYFFYHNDKAAVYFSALAVTWGIRAAFSNQYLFTSVFPDVFSWETTVRIEYLTLYMTMIWALLFVHALFRYDTSNVFKYFFVSCNLIFSIFTVILDPRTFTQFLPVYLSFALVLLLYIIYVVIHAIFYERPGVWLIVTCMILGVLIFGYDLGAYQGLSTYNSMLVNGGYILIFLLLSAALWTTIRITTTSKRRNDLLRYDDLYTNK